MKIVLIRNYNPYYENGASANRFASLVDGLQKNGAEVKIVVTRGYTTIEEKKKNNSHYSYNGVEIIYFGTALNHTLFRRRLNKYVFSTVLSKIVKIKLKKVLTWDYDYLWLTYNEDILSFFCNNYGKIKRSLIEINEFHDIYKQPGNLTNKAQMKPAQCTEALFLEAIKHIDCFAVMTQTLLGFYKPLSGHTAQFIHLPMTVDMSRFTITKEKTKPEYIAFAGALNNQKDGVDILIKAFGEISTEFPHLELKLAGGWQPDVEKQKEIIAKLGLGDRIKYIGLLTTDEIPHFFVNAQVLTLPRPDSHQAQGGFPTKLGEYLSTKNPVCVTKVGEIPKYLEDNVSAFMAIPGDVDSFANALTRALSDKENAKKVGETGYKVALENFNNEIQAKRLYNFLIDNLKK